jgi:hypothetical protein
MCDSRRNLCCTGTYHANGNSTEAQDKILFLTKLTYGHASFGSVISLDRSESICRFLRFIADTSKDMSEGPKFLRNHYEDQKWMGRWHKKGYEETESEELD